MILSALNALHERLAGDPARAIPPPGHSIQRISFRIVLHPDGSLFAIQDHRDTVTNRDGATTLVASPKLVPGPGKPPGRGIVPCFLWDSPEYMLGVRTGNSSPLRTQKCFDAFREKHIRLEDPPDCPEYRAVCRFLETWEPALAPPWSALSGQSGATGFGVFQIIGQPHFVHETPAIRDWWETRRHTMTRVKTVRGRAAKTVTGQCLVTGENAPLARLHEPPIRGVAGAAPTGARLVSFNTESSLSLGKTQGYNAPVSEAAAFRCATALNALLASKPPRSHRAQIGGVTCVFWTEKPAPFESLFTGLLGGASLETSVAGAGDLKLRAQLQSLLETLREGGGGRLAPLPAIRYHLLGLTASEARLQVRFFHSGALDRLLENLRAHYNDLRIKSPPYASQFPGAAQLLGALAPVRPGGQKRAHGSQFPVHFAEPLLRAILFHAPYPRALLPFIMERLRADAQITPLRAALIKAILNRNHKLSHTMSLDPDRSDPPYLCGRLFALIEKAQTDALPGVSQTVKDRFFRAASVAPATVFPLIHANCVYHISKLPVESHRVHYDKLLQSITAPLRDFPARLTVEEQGVFTIGYYHQRQEFFTKREKPSASSATQTSQPAPSPIP